MLTFPSCGPFDLGAFAHAMVNEKLEVLEVSRWRKVVGSSR